MEVINKLLICPACNNDNLQNDFEFVNAIPKVKPFSPFTINEKLFKYNPKGNTIDHFIVQLSSIINGYREGGLFIMIGKKK